MDTRVISIGTLGANPLWGEREPVRTGHATTTLIRTDDIVLLVDPGLPGTALKARLAERANIGPEAVTHVFLTSFLADARRGIETFERAQWLISEVEREALGVPLAKGLKQLADHAEGDDERASLLEALRHDIAVLQRCSPAPDRIAPGIDLFPLHGVTPGMTGLLLPGHRADLLICGDAIPTLDHLEQGKVLPNSQDIDQARESFQDAIEIADMLILGRDNLVPNPTKRPF